ncbi:MAG: hypothetical protein LBB23_02565 [Rickettsiales bacterium]|nr:hypothetical protein [Rickettsiales bacterium]
MHEIYLVVYQVVAMPLDFLRIIIGGSLRFPARVMDYTIHPRLPPTLRYGATSRGDDGTLCVP